MGSAAKAELDDILRCDSQQLQVLCYFDSTTNELVLGKLEEIEFIKL